MPILPTNMLAMIMYLDGSDRSAVMPVVRPTVPKADTSSNNNLKISVSGSSMERKNVAMKIKEAENIKMEKALLTNRHM